MTTEIKEEPENIFDLHAIVPVVKEIETSTKSSIITSENQHKLLTDYIEVPREKWSSLPNRIHIRYLRKDGNFRRGGFIKNIWSNVKNDSTTAEFFQLSTTLSYNSKNWKVPFSSIDKVWKTKKFNDGSEKIDQFSKTAESNTEQIEYLNKTIDQLKIDVAKLSNEQTRVINLIKKLHHLGRSNRS